MRNFYLKIMLPVLIFISSEALFSQQIITEYSNVNQESNIQYKRHFDENNYTKISDENGRKVYVQNEVIQQNETQAEDGVNEVTLTINLNFDPEEFEAPWMIKVYDESGYWNFGFWEGANPVTVNVPPGNYDIFAEFINIPSGGNSYYVIKEQESVQDNTTIEINPAEATNYVSINIYNEDGNLLEPGVLNPETGINSTMFFDRTIFFLPDFPKNSYTSSYTYGVPFYGDSPAWNFYVNNVSDRYSMAQTGGGIWHEGNLNYFSKFPTLNGVTESVTLENNPEDWVYHQEKLKSTPLGESVGIVHPAVSTLPVFDGMALMGTTIFNTTIPFDPEEGFKAYMNNSFDDDPAGLLVFPSIVDYVGTMPWGDDAFFTRGASIAKNFIRNISLYGRLVFRK